MSCPVIERRMSVTTVGKDYPIVTKRLYNSLCALAVFSLYFQDVHARALSQDGGKANIIIKIDSWENRTAHPRFLVYRDQRRRLEERSRETPPDAITEDENGGNIESYTFSVISSSAKQSEPIDESSSLEQLLTEQDNGVMTFLEDRNGNNNENLEDEQYLKEVISFPKDQTNPCNRLQIGPEEVIAEVSTSVKKDNATEDELEVDRGSFPTPPENTATNANEAEIVKNAVPTLDLVMKIVSRIGWDDENAVFSPLSVANVLSILLLGSGGETHHELTVQLDKISHVDDSPWDIMKYHESFHKLITYLKMFSGKGVIFRSASEMFVDSYYTVNEQFKNDLLTYYDAPLESFNFGKDGRKFMTKVNNWVRENTQNQIQKILEEPPSASTSLGILNAVYFKGPWETPFNEKLTRWKDFYVKPGEIIKARMMINILSIPYVERETYRMTAVPYQGNRTALFLILPRGNGGIKELKNIEQSISRKELDSSIADMKESRVALTLPKLKFSSDGEMVRILENIGLSSVFNENKANFSLISPQGLYISRLLHRAVIEINEKGTEASAVSLGTGDRLLEDVPVPFVCDKPFLFFIFHVDAETVLFWGRVVRPDSNQVT